MSRMRFNSFYRSPHIHTKFVLSSVGRCVIEGPKAGFVVPLTVQLLEGFFVAIRSAGRIERCIFWC